MKSALLLLPLALAGCHTAAPVSPSLSSPAAVSARLAAPVAPESPAPPPTDALEQRVRRQRQTIDALVSQNDALTAKLAASARATPPPSAQFAPAVPTPNAFAPVPTPAEVPPAPPPAPASREPLLTPNADGLIDLAARPTANPDAPVNPFAVRSISPDSLREITLHVGGIIAGPVACAVINDRLLQAGESIESLTVDRIDASAVYFRYEGRRLRVPVSSRPVRVRLPL
jgi:hypothetical protein